MAYGSYAGLLTWSSNKSREEDQLSQTDRAMLHVTEYFAKSLKVTQGHSK